MACAPLQTWVWLSVMMRSRTPLTLPLTRGWELNGRKAQGLCPCPALVLNSPCVPWPMCTGEGVWSQTAGGWIELLPPHWKATPVAWSRYECQQHTSIEPYTHRYTLGRWGSRERELGAGLEGEQAPGLASRKGECNLEGWPVQDPWGGRAHVLLGVCRAVSLSKSRGTPG